MSILFDIKSNVNQKFYLVLNCVKSLFFQCAKVLLKFFNKWLALKTFASNQDYFKCLNQGQT